MVVLRDQSFPGPGGRLGYDFFRPNGEGPFPLVVFIHGGGWISGDRTMYRDEAVWLAPQGFACACIEYRLAPLYTFPSPVADVQAFLRHARSEASALSIDPARVTAIGNSAGGHLACMLGLADVSFDGSAEPPEKADGVVAICPITDLTDPDASHFPVAVSFLEQFMGSSHFEQPDQWREASPMHHVSPNDRPFLILHGTDDDIVPIKQSRALASSMQGLGIASQLVELPGESHSFSFEAWSTIRSHYVTFLNNMKVGART